MNSFMEGSFIVRNKQNDTTISYTGKNKMKDALDLRKILKNLITI